MRKSRVANGNSRHISHFLQDMETQTAENIYQALKPKGCRQHSRCRGMPWFWRDETLPALTITCLNYDKKVVEGNQNPGNKFVMVEGDGCSLPYADKSFSLVFSNSVIEHVGDFSRQKQFASELRRVGQKLWVQTPAFECFIEPHFWSPFFHWLPIGLRIRWGRWLTLWGWLEKPSPDEVLELVKEIRLLNKREFKSLFPDCEIITEKMLWIFPKSYIAVRRA